MKIYLPPVLEVSNNYLHFKHIKAIQHSTAIPSWSLLQLGEGKELALAHLDLFTQSPSYARLGRPIEKCLQSSLKEKTNKTLLLEPLCAGTRVWGCLTASRAVALKHFPRACAVDENTACSDGICNLGLEVAQQPWHSPSWAQGSPGSISAAQGTGAVKPPGPRSVPPHHCCPLHRNCREGGQHLHCKDVLGFHLQMRVGNGFCLLHDRETLTNLQPEM